MHTRLSCNHEITSSCRWWLIFCPQWNHIWQWGRKTFQMRGDAVCHCAGHPSPHGELLTKQHALQLVKTKILASCKAHHLQIKMWNTVLQFKLYNIIISMLLRCEKIKSWKIFSTYTVVLLFSISVWGFFKTSSAHNCTTDISRLWGTDYYMQ